MQFKDAASAARAAAESAERAASAAKAAADFANKNSHPFDEVEDCTDSAHGYIHPRKRQSISNSSRSSRKEDTDAFDEIKLHGGKALSTGSFSGTNHVQDSAHGYSYPRKRQSMSNSSRSSRKEDTDAFDEIKTHGGKASSTGSFSGVNHVEDRDNYPVDLDTRKTRRRNSRAARKVHSEIKFDDSEGLCSESEDENDVEIQSIERQLPPTREPFSENRHSEEEGPDNDFPELPKANLQSRVHPNMPLDYETLTARFEALKTGKLP
jgi:vacuolar protein sorting-associated protein IST1